MHSRQNYKQKQFEHVETEASHEKFIGWVIKCQFTLREKGNMTAVAMTATTAELKTSAKQQNSLSVLCKEKAFWNTTMIIFYSEEMRAMKS